MAVVDDPTAILADHLSIEFEAGAEWRTEAVQAVSGITVYNKMRTRPVHVFSLNAGDVRMSYLQELKAHHMGRRGRLRSFPFKDHTDYQGVNEFIGTGDGSEDEFQVVKNYDPANVNVYQRDITIIKSGTLVVRVNGTPTTAFTETDGLLTFTSPPTNGHIIRADYEFYVPVNYLQDLFRINNKASNASWGTGGPLDCMEVLPT